MVKSSKIIALIVAAGRGERFGGAIPKPYVHLAGKAVLRHSVERFLDHPAVSSVKVVINPSHRGHYEAATRGLSLLSPVAGGAARQESVRNGLESLKNELPDFVLIHDAARPLVSEALITRVISSLTSHKAVIPAIPVPDTLKEIKNNVVERTVPRDRLVAVQTPQGFHFEAILHTHQKAPDKAFTDDAAIAEHAGIEVAMVLGERDNIKITTPDDLHMAELLMGKRSLSRVGMGFDVHAFGPGKQNSHIMLCGVQIPHPCPLLGHSDADVGLHALTDALLGALAKGDIGEHFPPSDPQWKGADSAIFIAHTLKLLEQAGGIIHHVDITIIAEAPKVSPHREAMRKRVAELLGISITQVSIKATTTEGLGFTGRGEGIAAQAVATIVL